MCNLVDFKNTKLIFTVGEFHNRFFLQFLSTHANCTLWAIAHITLTNFSVAAAVSHRTFGHVGDKITKSFSRVIG